MTQLPKCENDHKKHWDHRNVSCRLLLPSLHPLLLIVQAPCVATACHLIFHAFAFLHPAVSTLPSSLLFSSSPWQSHLTSQLLSSNVAHLFNFVALQLFGSPFQPSSSLAKSTFPKDSRQFTNLSPIPFQHCACFQTSISDTDSTTIGDG